MSVSDLRIIVAGGGIGGLSAALLLGRAGAEVTLVERVADPAEVGAGLLLQPNGLAVLQHLGLGEVLSRAGCPTRGSSVRTATGTVITAITAPDYGPGLDQLIAIRRGALYTALLAAVRNEPGVRCRFGTTVVGAERVGRVTIAPNANGGRTRELTGDLVIGADGVGSVVRAAGEFGASVDRTGHRYLRAVVGRGQVGTDNNAAAADGLNGEYWTGLGLFGGTRIDDDHLYFYADVAARETSPAVAERDLAALRRSWMAALPVAGELLGRVETFDDLLINDVSLVQCRRWHDGRLVLLGDAAHAMPPTVGQGANSALVDAAVLALELAEHPVQDALMRYGRRRRPAVRAVQRRAVQLARLAGLRNGFARSVRDRALGLLGRLPGGGERVARSLQQEDPSRLLESLHALHG